MEKLDNPQLYRAKKFAKAINKLFQRNWLDNIEVLNIYHDGKNYFFVLDVEGLMIADDFYYWIYHKHYRERLITYFNILDPLMLSCPDMICMNNTETETFFKIK